MTARRGRKPAQELDLDLLSKDAREQLSRWTQADQQLFAELLQDAPTELQQEMIQRALAAAHTPAELHAFCDEIRPLSDEEVFDACTLADARSAHSVVERLRAEADPIYGFELNGHQLTPKLEDDAGPAYDTGAGGRPMRRLAAALMVPPAPPQVGPKPRGYAPESSVAWGKTLALLDLGVSTGGELPERKAPSPAGGTAVGAEGRIAEDLMNEAVRALGLTFREQAVDGP
ncbi:MAG: hypothetical protein ACYC8T_21915, partial [Myxococcaceae bacterium]